MNEANKLNEETKIEGNLEKIDQAKEIDKMIHSSKSLTSYMTIENNNIDISLYINKKTSRFDLYKGLFYMLISCICKSLFSIISKVCLDSKKDLTSFQLLTFRTYFMMCINFVILIVSPVKVFSEEFISKNKLIPMIVRSILAIFSMTLVIYSLKFIHISDVYAIYYIYPGLIILFSSIFLKERMNYLDYICLIACFVGALLIVKPDFLFPGIGQSHEHRLSILGLVLIAAFLKAVEDVIVRDAANEFHFLAVPFLYSCVGIVLFPIPMMIFDKIYPRFTILEVVGVFFVAVFTYLYQAFMALGLQNENAGRVSMINYFQLAFMYISDILIFKREFVLIDLFGTILIVGFNFINGLYKCNKRMDDLTKFQKRGTNENC